MKVKAQRLQYEMRKIKGEIEEANSRHEGLSHGSDCYKVIPYIHVVEALNKSIASRQSSLFRGLNHGHLDPDFH